MKHVYIFLLLTSLLGLVTVSCSAPADRNILDYEQSLIHADSLVQSGSADSACAVRLLSDLHADIGTFYRSCRLQAWAPFALLSNRMETPFLGNIRLFHAWAERVVLHT